MASPPSACTLHHLNNSQSQRILWLLEELAHAYPTTFAYSVELYHRDAAFRAPPALAAVHPAGRSPVLVTAAGRTIAESSAIATFLVRTHDVDGLFRQHALDGDGDGDSGEDDWVRAEELVSFGATSLGTLGMVMFMTGTIVPRMAPWAVWPLLAPAGRLMAYGTRPEMRKAVARLEAELLASQRGGASGFFSGGAGPGKVDILLSFPVDVVVELELADMAAFPALTAWRARCQARPAWKRALEKGNGYDWTAFRR